jgi:hypothetical protein
MQRGRSRILEGLLLVCFGLGFLGQLVSPRYGWLLGVVLAVPVFILMLIGSFKEFRRGCKKRPR